MNPRANHTESDATPLRLVAWLVTGLALGCGAADDGPSTPPDVVLLVLDTVRADHLSCYGYEVPTTPRIDALAEVADRHEVARATAPWTLPSHASMFTGVYPFAHGAQARKNAKTGAVREHALRTDRTTLAEVLSEEGYETAAFVANGGYLSSGFGLNRGFETYAEKQKGEPARGPNMLAKVVSWLDGRASERPFFLFVNFMDAHRPYNVAALPPERAAVMPPADPEHPKDLLDQLCHVVLETDEVPSPELIRRVVTQYDTGIANLDLVIGDLLDELRDRGLYENTLIIVTADHGEYFGEHDLTEHSKDIYEEALRVPLIVKHPGQVSGRVLPGPTSLVDLPCLVLSSLPAEARDRRAGTFPCSGPDVQMAEVRYTRGKDLLKPYGSRFMRERTVIYAGNFKAILSTDGKHELYDLTADPLEQSNLIDARADLGQRLLELAEQMRREGESKTGGDVELSPEDLEELERLGYL